MQVSCYKKHTHDNKLVDQLLVELSLVLLTWCLHHYGIRCIGIVSVNYLGERARCMMQYIQRSLRLWLRPGAVEG